MLGEVLDGLLRLLHPLVPFVTESLWTALTGGESIVIAAWPQCRGVPAGQGRRGRHRQLQARVVLIRQFLSAQGVKPGQRIPARFTGPCGAATSRRSAGCCGWSSRPTGFSADRAAGTRRRGHVELDLSTAVDVGAERARLERDRAAAAKELEQTGHKLANDAFLAKAKPEVVDSVRARNSAAAADLRRIDEALARLPRLTAAMTGPAAAALPPPSATGPAGSRPRPGCWPAGASPRSGRPGTGSTS